MYLPVYEAVNELGQPVTLHVRLRCAFWGHGARLERHLHKSKKKE